MKNKLLSLWFMFAVLAFAGCGYSTHSALPSDYRTIHIEDFKNKVEYTSERIRTLYLPLLEVKVQNAVVNRFQFDGSLRVAKSDTADMQLSGELIGFDRDVLRYAANNTDVQEYRIRIMTNLRLIDTVTQEVIWEENNFAGEATYFVTGANAKSESAAVADATVDLARRVVERTVENW